MCVCVYVCAYVFVRGLICLRLSLFIAHTLARSLPFTLSAFDLSVSLPDCSQVAGTGPAEC